MKYEDIELNELFRETFISQKEAPLFTNYKKQSYSYEDVAKLIFQFHDFFKQCHIQKGDKIALIGENSAHWGICFLATLSYGAVIVPVLPEFTAADCQHIINHSESKILLASNHQIPKMDITKMEHLQAVMNIDTLDTIWARKTESLLFWKNFNPSQCTHGYDTFWKESMADDDLCMISYTSGTSGFTKGVMLPYRALKSNLVFARENMDIREGNNILSFLPMAHVFGLLFEFLFPVSRGCHITFLSKLPTPQVLIEAFAKVKPHLILSVPLVIEKIYFKQIKPELNKPLTRLMMKSPLKGMVRKKVYNKLVETFGGNFKELVIGGAALNKEVEEFFRSIKFPFTIGYGMTECAPLISYAPWNTTKAGSAGSLVDRLELKIDSSDPYKEVGEVLVKGDNVMLGYYKNEQATAESIDKDGWLHTGDLATTDKDQFIFIKGRCKSMLLGPSGQNIYPELIEAKYLAKDFVQECAVVDRGGKITALIYPDHESLGLEVSKEDIGLILNNYRKEINKEIPKFSYVAKIEIMDSEFEKTPKKSIKRYLYV